MSEEKLTEAGTVRGMLDAIEEVAGVKGRNLLSAMPIWKNI